MLVLEFKTSFEKNSARDWWSHPRKLSELLVRLSAWKHGDLHMTMRWCAAVCFGFDSMLHRTTLQLEKLNANEEKLIQPDKPTHGIATHCQDNFTHCDNNKGRQATSLHTVAPTEKHQQHMNKNFFNSTWTNTTTTKTNCKRRKTHCKGRKTKCQMKKMYHNFSSRKCTHVGEFSLLSCRENHDTQTHTAEVFHWWSPESTNTKSWSYEIHETHNNSHVQKCSKENSLDDISWMYTNIMDVNNAIRVRLNFGTDWHARNKASPSRVCARAMAIPNHIIQMYTNVWADPKRNPTELEIGHSNAFNASGTTGCSECLPRALARGSVCHKKNPSPT